MRYSCKLYQPPFHVAQLRGCMMRSNLARMLLLMLWLCLLSGSGQVESAAGELPLLGAPRVVLTHSHAIGIAGWQAADRLVLMLDAPQHQHAQVILLDPATGQQQEVVAAATRLAWEAAVTAAGRTVEPLPHRTDPAAAVLLDAQWRHDGALRAAILAPAAQPAAPVRHTILQIVNVETGQVVSWQDAPPLVTDIAWSPDGRWLAVLAVTQVTAAGAERAQLFLIEPLTGVAYLARPESFGGGVGGRQLAWSPDGIHLAVGCPTAQEGRVCLLPVGAGSTPRLAWRPPAEASMPVPLPTAPGTTAATFAYTPPTDITLEVYVLTLGGARRLPLTLCTPASTAWGCTAFCDELNFPCVRTVTLPYPYSTNPITIPIESDYLLDVVPVEMGPYYHQTALIAQAAAARSYALRNLYDGRAINNSTAFQAFIPYKFESLPPVRFPDTPETPCMAGNLNLNQQIICNAVTPDLYITYDLTPEVFVPVFAEFSADAWLRTVDGGRPYLRGVEDPISSGCDANNYGHQRGMSQEGASRWARGNRCSYGGAGNDPWSVRWDDARQILTHYYTGIQLRSRAGERLTPDYRWVPLEIDWRSGSVYPPLLQPETPHLITLTVQNTGVFSWTRHVALAHYGWEDEAGIPSITATMSVSLPHIVAPGASVRVGFPLIPPPQTEPVRRYRVRLDMVLHTAEAAPVGFSLREPERPWPTHDVLLTVRHLPYKTFLPLAQRD